MNYLCVCQYGHSRSVALARVLHGCRQTAVACGHATAGTALPVLCGWADKILILDDGFRGHIPKEHWHKVVSMHVGPDRWVNPYHPELNAMLTEMVEKRLGLKKER